MLHTVNVMYIGESILLRLKQTQNFVIQQYINWDLFIYNTSLLWMKWDGNIGIY